MFGIEALDVVIGMIFIYLLFSLFVTIVNEMLNSMRQIRGKELSFAIEQLVGEEAKASIYTDYRIKRITKRSSLYYRVPIIWSLIKIFRGVKHYRIHTLNYKKIKKELEESGVIEKYDSVNLLLQWIEKKNKIFLLNSFLKFQILTKKEKITKTVLPSEIKNELFTQIVFELYKQNPQIFNKSDFNEGIKNKNLDDASLKIYINESYQDMMDYLIDWYKRKLRYVLLGIGFLVALIFNANSIEIFKTLRDNPEIRSKVVEQATKYVEEYDSLDPGLKMNTQDFDDYKKDLLELRNKEIAQLESNLGMGWNFKGYELEPCFCLDKKFWSMAWEQSGFQGIFGWLITALATSLGSSFWFDLLKKVINLKNDIKKNKPVG